MSLTAVQLSIDTQPLLQSLAQTQAAMEKFARNFSETKIVNSSLDDFNKSVNESIQFLQRLDVSKLSNQMATLREGFKAVASEILKVKGAAVDLKDAARVLAGFQRYFDKLQQNGGTVKLTVAFDVSVNFDKNKINVSSIKPQVEAALREEIGEVGITVPVQAKFESSSLQRAINSLSKEERTVSLIAGTLFQGKDAKVVKVKGEIVRLGVADYCNKVTVYTRGVIQEVVLSDEIANGNDPVPVVPVRGMITDVDISEEQRKKFAEAGNIPAIAFNITLSEATIKSLQKVNGATQVMFGRVTTAITKNVSEAVQFVDSHVGPMLEMFNSLCAAAASFGKSVEEAAAKTYTIKFNADINRAALDNAVDQVTKRKLSLEFQLVWSPGSYNKYHQIKDKVDRLATTGDEYYPLKFKMVWDSGEYETIYKLITSLQGLAEGIDFTKLRESVNEIKTLISDLQTATAQPILLTFDVDKSALSEALNEKVTVDVVPSISPQKTQNLFNRVANSVQGLFGSRHKSGVGGTSPIDNLEVKQTVEFVADLSKVENSLQQFKDQNSSIPLSFQVEENTNGLKSINTLLQRTYRAVRLINRLVDKAQEKITAIRIDLSDRKIQLQFKSTGLNAIAQDLDRLKRYAASKTSFSFVNEQTGEESQNENGVVAGLDRIDVASVQTLNITGAIRDVKQIGPIGYAEQIGPIHRYGDAGPNPFSGGNGGGTPHTDSGNSGIGTGTGNISILNNKQKTSDNGTTIIQDVDVSDWLPADVILDSTYTPRKYGRKPEKWVDIDPVTEPSEEQWEAMGKEQKALLKHVWELNLVQALMSEQSVARAVNNTDGVKKTEKHLGAIYQQYQTLKEAILSARGETSDGRRVDEDNTGLSEYFTKETVDRFTYQPRKSGRKPRKWVDIELGDEADESVLRKMGKEQKSLFTFYQKQREVAIRELLAGSDSVPKTDDVNNMLLALKRQYEELKSQIEAARKGVEEGGSLFDSEGDHASAITNTYFKIPHPGQKKLERHQPFKGAVRDIDNGYGLYRFQEGEFRLPSKEIEEKFEDVRNKIYEGIFPSKKQLDDLRANVADLMPTFEELGGKDYKAWFSEKFGVEMRFEKLSGTVEETVNVLRNYSAELITASKILGVVPSKSLKIFGDMKKEDEQKYSGMYYGAEKYLSINKDRAVEENMGTIWHETVHALFDQLLNSGIPDDKESLRQFYKFYRDEADAAHKRIDSGAAWVTPYAYGPTGSYKNWQELVADALKIIAEGGATNKAVQAVMALVSRMKFSGFPSVEEQEKHGTLNENTSDVTPERALGYVEAQLKKRLELLNNDTSGRVKKQLLNEMPRIEEIFDTIYGKLSESDKKRYEDVRQSIEDKFTDINNQLPYKQDNASDEGITPSLFGDDDSSSEIAKNVDKIEQSVENIADKIQGVEQYFFAATDVKQPFTLTPGEILKKYPAENGKSVEDIARVLRKVDREEQWNASTEAVNIKAREDVRKYEDLIEILNNEANEKIDSKAAAALKYITQQAIASASHEYERNEKTAMQRYSSLPTREFDRFGGTYEEELHTATSNALELKRVLDILNRKKDLLEGLIPENLDIDVAGPDAFAGILGVSASMKDMNKSSASMKQAEAIVELLEKAIRREVDSKNFSGAERLLLVLQNLADNISSTFNSMHSIEMGDGLDHRLVNFFRSFLPEVLGYIPDTPAKAYAPKTKEEVDAFNKIDQAVKTLTDLVGSSTGVSKEPEKHELEGTKWVGGEKVILIDEDKYEEIGGRFWDKLVKKLEAADAKWADLEGRAIQARSAEKEPDQYDVDPEYSINPKDKTFQQRFKTARLGYTGYDKAVYAQYDHTVRVAYQLYGIYNEALSAARKASIEIAEKWHIIDAIAGRFSDKDRKTAIGGYHTDILGLNRGFNEFNQLMNQVGQRVARELAFLGVARETNYGVSKEEREDLPASGRRQDFIDSLDSYGQLVIRALMGTNAFSNVTATNFLQEPGSIVHDYAQNIDRLFRQGLDDHNWSDDQFGIQDGLNKQYGMLQTPEEISGLMRRASSLRSELGLSDDNLASKRKLEEVLGLLVDRLRTYDEEYANDIESSFKDLFQNNTDARDKIEAANQIASAGKAMPLLLTYDPNAVQKAIGPENTVEQAPVIENAKKDAERIEKANELIKKEDAANEKEKQVVDKAANDATEIIKAAGDDIADTVEKTAENVEKTVEEEIKKPTSPRKPFVNKDFDSSFGGDRGGNNPPPSPPGGGGGNGPRGPRGPNGPNGPNDGSFGMSGLANASWDARRAMDLMFSRETINRIDKFREAIAKLLEHMLALADAVERVKRSEVINLAIRTSGGTIAGAPRVSAPRGGAPAGQMVDRRRHSESVLPYGTDPTGTTSTRMLELQRAFRAMYYDARRLSTVVRNFFSTGVVANGLKQIISMAADAEENFAKFDIVFENTMDTANEAFKNLTENYRLADTTAKKMLADTGNLLIGFGIPEAEAAKMSAQIQTMASDLALFTNYEGRAEGASVALTKAIYGRREAAKRLGLAITESAVKERMAALVATGYAQSTEKGTKALATIQIMQEQAAKAYGATARETQHFWAQVDALRASFDNLKVKLGNAIKGIAEVFVRALNSVMKTISQLPEPVIKVALSFAALVSTFMAVGMAGVGLLVWYQSLRRTITFASKKIYDHTVALRNGQSATVDSSKAIEAQTAVMASNAAVTGEAVTGVNTLASAQEAESVIRQLATDVVNTETAAIQANTAAKLANAEVQPVTAQTIMSESVNQFNMMAARQKDADKGLNALGLPGQFPRDKKTRETIATMDGAMNGRKTGPHYDGNGNMVRNVDLSVPDDYYDNNRHFKTASGAHSPKVQELYYNTERAMEKGNMRGLLEGYDEQVIVGRREDGEPIFDTKHRDVLKYAPKSLSAVDSRGEVNEQIAGQIAKQRGIYKGSIDTKVRNRTEELVSGIRNGKYSSQVSRDAGLMGIRVNESEDKVNSLKAELEERIKSSGFIKTIQDKNGREIPQSYTVEHLQDVHDKLVQRKARLEELVNDTSLKPEYRLKFQGMLDDVTFQVNEMHRFMKDTGGLQKQIAAAEREFNENSSALYNRIEGQVRSGRVKDIQGLGRQTFEIEGLGTGTAEHLAAKASNLNTLDNSEIVRSQDRLRKESAEKIFSKQMKGVNASITDEAIENTPLVKNAYGDYIGSINAKEKLPALEEELSQANQEVSRIENMLDTGVADEATREKHRQLALQANALIENLEQESSALQEEITSVSQGKKAPSGKKLVGKYKTGDTTRDKYRNYDKSEYGEYIAELQKKKADIDAKANAARDRFNYHSGIATNTGQISDEFREELEGDLVNAANAADSKQRVVDEARQQAADIDVNKRHYDETKESERRRIFVEGESAAKEQYLRQRFHDKNVHEIYDIQPDGSYTTDADAIAQNTKVVKSKRRHQDKAVENWKWREKANKNRERQSELLSKLGVTDRDAAAQLREDTSKRVSRIESLRAKTASHYDERIGTAIVQQHANKLNTDNLKNFIANASIVTDADKERVENAKKELALLESEATYLEEYISKNETLKRNRLAAIDAELDSARKAVKTIDKNLGQFDKLEDTIKKQESKIVGNEFINPKDVEKETLEYTDLDGNKKKIVSSPGLVSDDKVERSVLKSDKVNEIKERAEKQRAVNEKARSGLSNADAGIVSSSGVLPPTNGPAGPSGPSGPDGPDWPDWPDGPEVDPNTKKYIDRHNKKLAKQYEKEYKEKMFGKQGTARYKRNQRLTAAGNVLKNKSKHSKKAVKNARRAIREESARFSRRKHMRRLGRLETFRRINSVRGRDFLTTKRNWNPVNALTFGAFGSGTKANSFIANAFKNVFKPIGGMMTKMWAPLKKALEIPMKYISVFSKIFGGAFKKIFLKFIPFVGWASLIATAIAGLGQLFKRLPTWIEKFIYKYGDVIKASIGKFFRKIPELIEKAGVGLMMSVAYIANGIKELFLRAIGKVTETQRRVQLERVDELIEKNNALIKSTENAQNSIFMIYQEAANKMIALAANFGNEMRSITARTSEQKDVIEQEGKVDKIKSEIEGLMKSGPGSEEGEGNMSIDDLTVWESIKGKSVEEVAGEAHAKQAEIRGRLREIGSALERERGNISAINEAERSGWDSVELMNEDGTKRTVKKGQFRTERSKLKNIVEGNKYSGRVGLVEQQEELRKQFDTENSRMAMMNQYKQRGVDIDEKRLELEKEIIDLNQKRLKMAQAEEKLEFERGKLGSFDKAGQFVRNDDYVDDSWRKYGNMFERYEAAQKESSRKEGQANYEQKDIDNLAARVATVNANRTQYEAMSKQFNVATAAASELADLDTKIGQLEALGDNKSQQDINELNFLKQSRQKFADLTGYSSAQQAEADIMQAGAYLNRLSQVVSIDDLNNAEQLNADLANARDNQERKRDEAKQSRKDSLNELNANITSWQDKFSKIMTPEEVMSMQNDNITQLRKMFENAETADEKMGIIEQMEAAEDKIDKLSESENASSVAITKGTSEAFKAENKLYNSYQNNMQKTVKQSNVYLKQMYDEMKAQNGGSFRLKVE